MNIELKCTCGKVKGVASNITPSNGNRVVCCCDDCQAFAHSLERGADILDEFGGTDIFQTSQSQVSIHQGTEHLRCIKLTPKGMVRWYTDCCNTPIGNTMNASMPFIGLIHTFLDNTDNRDSQLGAVRAFVQTRFAIGTHNYPSASEKFSFGIVFRVMRLMLGWKIRGMNRPSPFFNEQGKPIVKPTILSENP